MSKIISFKGAIPDGLEERIKLSTLNGKRGYRITRFETMANKPGEIDYQTTTKIYAKAQGAGSTAVDFTESDLLAVSIIEDHEAQHYPYSQQVIFDNHVFNQDIYINVSSLVGSLPTNYYLELETVALTDVEATQLTLKSLRQIASR